MMRLILTHAIYAGLLSIAAPAMASDGATAAPLGQQAGSGAAQGQGARPEFSQLQLRWELLRNVVAPGSGDGRALARLTLTNGGAQAVPRRGWALYFNSIDGVVTAELDSGLVLEQVSGQLYRLRPGRAFRGVAPGARLDIDYFHRTVMVLTMKAPMGPYIVFDDQPETGHRIDDYRIGVLNRPEQLDAGPSEPTPVTTAEALFARNARIRDLPLSAVSPVFPTPVKAERTGGVLRLATLPAIQADAAVANEAAQLKSMLARYLDSAAGSSPVASVRLRVAPVSGQASPEAYALEITPAGILLTGASPAGVYRGIQSLRDLLPLARGAAVELPALRIVDAPRFGYRGFQLDVARNFYPKETVFRLLDLMARYKLNKFHFHLTDDEGWRLDIAGLPELTTFGARRGHTLSVAEHLQPAYGSGPDVNDPRGSGHYRREDYIAILKYAAARHIEVIPEIEMPGHARAAVFAMDRRARRLEREGAANPRQFQLHDPDDRSEYTSPQLYNDQVLNPGMPSTYDFIAHVVADVVAMHKEAGTPLSTLHVGGDELANGAWEKSPASRRLMERLQLADTTELWDYFYTRVDEILKRHSLHASGWEELGARKARLKGVPKLIPNPVFTQRGFRVQVWNNLGNAEDLAYRLANSGYATVLSPVTNLYFDMAYNRNPGEPGVHWGAYIELDKVFDFIPFDYLKNAPANPAAAHVRDGLTDYGQRHIVGLEATLFTETVRDVATMDYLIMPRMLALAERAWAQDPAWTREPDAAKAGVLHDADWSAFVNQLGKRVLPRLDAEQAGIAYRIAPPGLRVVDGKLLANHQLPGLALRYTVDGSEPGAGSALVTGPIRARGTIKVAAFAADGRAGPSSSMVLR